MVHLHVHSHFSLLQATPPVDVLVARAAADGLPALALTDSNVLHGAVAFGRACTVAGIQPLVGMQLTVAPPPDLGQGEAPDRIVLLARDRDGWRSLCRLSSLLQNHSDREERARRGVSWDDLRQNHAGLLCIAGGRRSGLERLLRLGDANDALRLVGKLAGLFGEDATVLALELHKADDQTVAAEVVALGKRLGLPARAVQPVWTLEPGERDRLRLLAAIARNCTLDEVPDHALPDGGDETVAVHWLSPKEMAARFAAVPGALDFDDLVSRCAPCLPDGRPTWPAVELGENADADAALRAQAEAGLVDRFGTEVDDAARDRLVRELDAITGHEFAPLFLLVAELVGFSRRQAIPVSTRGSVANSLVAFCLGISDVNPLAHDLLFERFLNPARSELPDIDLDFCSRRRDEVLARARHGADRVALVATVSTFQPKSALRETAKAHGLSETEATALSKRVRRGWHPDPRRRQGMGLDELLAELDDPRLRRVVRQAVDLISAPHHLSVHPGGLVVTPTPLTDHVPLQHAPKGFAITQFDHHDVETLGLVKVDLLGIRALTVLAHAAALVRTHHDPDFRLEAIPDDDAATADLLERAETVGVFQCESTGAQRTLRQLRARTPGDLAVVNAFFKPGPATGGMADAFVRRYRGEEEADYLHPSLEPILRPTRGVLLFQEQVLRLATEIAGLRWAEAEHLRRGMSKFQLDEMARMEDRFIAGCCRTDGPGLSQEQARTLWEQVAAFAGYGFNQGHATAYAAVSYRSAFCKAHWPAEFLCARLADRGGFHHPALYIAEAWRLGIGVRPPHVNWSGRRFTLVKQQVAIPRDTLFMGLGAVKGLRRSAVKQIVAERKRHPFDDLRDLLGRVDLREAEIAHLIQCGALDGLGESRAALLAEADEIQRAGSVAQMGFDFWTESVQAESAAQRLAWEQELLGMPLSVHPLDLVAVPAESVPLAALPDCPGRRMTVAGVRLPGWTGGRGIYLGDHTTYIVAQLPDGARLERWQPVLLSGAWHTDAWGGGWFGMERVAVL